MGRFLKIKQEEIILAKILFRLSKRLSKHCCSSNSKRTKKRNRNEGSLIRRLDTCRRATGLILIFFVVSSGLSYFINSSFLSFIRKITFSVVSELWDIIV